MKYCLSSAFYKPLLAGEADGGLEEPAEAPAAGPGSLRLFDCHQLGGERGACCWPALGWQQSCSCPGREACEEVAKAFRFSPGVSSVGTAVGLWLRGDACSSEKVPGAAPGKESEGVKVKGQADRVVQGWELILFARQEASHQAPAFLLR